MKIVLGIYGVFIFLLYTAFFTLSGDLLNGLYILPPLVISIACLITTLILDIRTSLRNKDTGKKAKKYFTVLMYFNIPIVIFSFILPLVNGNKSIEQLQSESLASIIGGVVMIFLTAPLLGYIAGTVYDMFFVKEGVR
jgi:hypothetical protein